VRAWDLTVLARAANTGDSAPGFRTVRIQSAPLPLPWRRRFF